MGSLATGAIYTYDTESGVTFSVNTVTGERVVVGWDHDSGCDSKLWIDIHALAKNNPTLQLAIDRVIMLYKLSKDKV